MDNDQVPPQQRVPPPLNQPASPGPGYRRAPRRRGSGWMVFSLVLLMILMVVVAFEVLTFFGAGSSARGRQSGRVFHEVLVEDNRSLDKIAILDVKGLITSQSLDATGRNMVNLLEDQLDRAAEDDRVAAVILHVDSPGGEVMASDDIARTISKFQEETEKPVVAVMGGLAASGGYYVSAPCRWIVASELTITGSIGVIMQTFNYRGLMDKVGLYPVVFKSGKFKDMLRGSKLPEEYSEEAHQMMQEMINSTYERFKEVVAKGRGDAHELNGEEGRPLASNWEDYADGRILTGDRAFEVGLVDELGGFDTAVERAKQLAEIGEVNLIRYQEPFDLSRLFSLRGEKPGTTVKLDLGLGTELPKLEAGRMYFLSPTVLY